MIKKCEICGQDFIVKSNRQKYCAGCARKEHLEKVRAYKARERRGNCRREYGKIGRAASASIHEVVRLASQSGMSYGEYVAKMGL